MKKINDNFKIYCYAMNRDNEQSMNLSENILKIGIIENYAENVFPLFQIQFYVTKEVQDFLANNNVEFSLRIEKIENENTGTEQDAEVYFSSDIIFDGIITVLDKPHSFRLRNIDFDNESDETEKENSIENIYYTISGVPKASLEANNRIINKVYNDVQMNDILVNLTTYNVSSEIHIEESDNKDTLNSILIPPLNLVPALNYLQENYGIYRKGISVFFDLNKFYCKGFGGFREPEQTFLMQRKPIEEVDKENLSLPFYDETTGDIIYIIDATPNIDGQNIINNNLLGSTSIYFSYDDNFDLFKKIENNESENEKTRYFWNSNKNLIEEEFSKISLKTNKQFELLLKNIDPLYFSPMTRTVLSGCEEEYNNNYFLAEKNIIFSTNDKKRFSNKIFLRFIEDI